MLGYDPSDDPNVTKQTGFSFDDAAKVRTRSALVVELLRDRYPDGGSLDDLVRGVCKETPTTKATRRCLSTGPCRDALHGRIRENGRGAGAAAKRSLPRRMFECFSHHVPI